MHLLVRDTRTLDDDAPAQNPGQDPAPLVALSFSDADLGALAAAWHATPGLPALRLASLARLRHPMSTDLYLEQVAASASCLVIRLLGGLDYWRYGAEEAATLCRTNNIALALLPGDGADDTRLRALSTVPPQAWTALDDAFRAGGPANMALALQWAAHCANLAPRPTTHPEAVPAYGELHLHQSSQDTSWPDLIRPPTLSNTYKPSDEPTEPRNNTQTAAIILYRSHHLSADTAPIHALADALRAQGLTPRAIYVDSLKSPPTAAWTAETLRAWNPAIILNTTAFSAQTGGASPLDAPGCPVLQAVLSGNSRDAWAASTRGLSPTDLAMQVVLPELDGRLLTAAISFKTEAPRDEALQYGRTVHAPDPHGIALAAARAAGWATLAATPRAHRRLAITLSDYPGIGGQEGHAVGLDTFASLEAILQLLAANAYAVLTPTTPVLTQALTRSPPTPYLTLEAYAPLFRTLPQQNQDAITAAWGDPAQDPAIINGAFTLRHLQAGHATIALQPDRGSRTGRRAGFHDPACPRRATALPPSTSGFATRRASTPSSSSAPTAASNGSPARPPHSSETCFPRALLGGLPVIYPFIVNNPGEAAPAKRRLGAVTIGHLTPPLHPAPAHGAAPELERLLDEYATADGLDRRRATHLRTRILDAAATGNLLQESGIPPTADPDEALARLDAYLCDVKDLRIRDGLHTFGSPPQNPSNLEGEAESPALERQALLAALDGPLHSPGPAGAPTRGRADVLPTGRNLTTTDPRTVPDPGRHGCWPRTRRRSPPPPPPVRARRIPPQPSSSTPGAAPPCAPAARTWRSPSPSSAPRPTWDEGTARVSGFEILPIALLDRPRIDVTLRISGLFRDAFANQVALFDAAHPRRRRPRRSARLEPAGRAPPTPASMNQRIYGQYAPGEYGTGPGWLAASATSYGAANDGTRDLRSPENPRRRSRRLHPYAGPRRNRPPGQPRNRRPRGRLRPGRTCPRQHPRPLSPRHRHPRPPRPPHRRRGDRPRRPRPRRQPRLDRAARCATPIAGPPRSPAPSPHWTPTPAPSPPRFDAQFDLLHAATLGQPRSRRLPPHREPRSPRRHAIPLHRRPGRPACGTPAATARRIPGP